jgi:hypothetical protein
MLSVLIMVNAFHLEVMVNAFNSKVLVNARILILESTS